MVISDKTFSDADYLLLGRGDKDFYSYVNRGGKPVKLVEGASATTTVL